MNELREKYLPIGTVVLLQGAVKKVMITGFASMSPDTGERVFYDSGCPYPDVFFDYNQVCVFDHSQIKEIVYVGLENEEESEFKKAMVEKLAQMNSQQAQQ